MSTYEEGGLVAPPSVTPFSSKPPVTPPDEPKEREPEELAERKPKKPGPERAGEGSLQTHAFT